MPIARSARAILASIAVGSGRALIPGPKSTIAAIKETAPTTASAKSKAAPAMRPRRQDLTGSASVVVTTSTIDLEPDAHGHLELGDLRILDGTALLDHLEPVHVLDRLSRLDHRALHRLGEAAWGRADHFDELVDSGHQRAPFLFGDTIRNSPCHIDAKVARRWHELRMVSPVGNIRSAAAEATMEIAWRRDIEAGLSEAKGQGRAGPAGFRPGPTR